MTDEYTMKFDPAAIKHLGIQMYSTLPPVIAELVANAWDAGASRVDITVPSRAVTDSDTIVVCDDGEGMSDSDIRDKYLVVGRDKRVSEARDRRTDPDRPLMGRKGIGKFAGFGVARTMEIESARSPQEVSRLKMDYDLIDQAEEIDRREVSFPSLPPTGEVTQGTRVTLGDIVKYRSRSMNLQQLRSGLARRFSIIDADFSVFLNGEELTAEDRNYKSLLDVDVSGDQYIWNIDEEIAPNTGWRVTGWIGALKGTNRALDNIERGISIMARGKLVQEPFHFNATVGQQFALSYLIGELNAEFVDEAEDTIGTARNSLVWDTEANSRLLAWGKDKLNEISREWADKRARDNTNNLDFNPKYTAFQEKFEKNGPTVAFQTAIRLIKSVAKKAMPEDTTSVDAAIDFCVTYLEFDAFTMLADQIASSEGSDHVELINLFQEWELLEAKEMAKVTEGRIRTIKQLDELIITNALEVPTLHNFLKKFPWVLDPRWNLVSDETRYSDLLRERFPESAELDESDRRIDFLCVRESDTFVVVEIKRPQSVVNVEAMNQISDYVGFIRNRIGSSTDPEGPKNVVGYLLCGSVASGYRNADRQRQLDKDSIYIRRYEDLLSHAERLHAEFLDRYELLEQARSSHDDS